MSGIEVAGIALAVFPILLAGLGQVVVGIETVRLWRLYKIKLKAYATDMESAYVCLQNTLYELLCDIVQSEQELALMLEDPGGALWLKPEYDRRLRSRLDQSYDYYFNTISTLVTTLQSMSARLGIDRAGKTRMDDFSKMDRQKIKMRLVLFKNTYKEMLENIERANRNLRTVTEHSINFGPTKRKHRSQRLVADLNLVRRYATSLYRSLMNDRVWKCKCKSHHLASLRLEARPQTTEDLEADFCQTYTFRVLLSVQDGPNRTSSTTQWEDIDIISTLEVTAAVQTAQRVPNPVQTTSARRSVRPATVSEACLTSAPGGSTAGQIGKQYIDDFCSALKMRDRPDRQIGLVGDEEDDQQHHRLYRADTIAGLQTASKSLEDLLKPHRHSNDENLSRKDRLQIAVILASSVLQLDGTSWLNSRWSSTDIFFHYKEGHASDHSHPYLAWQNCYGSGVVPSFQPLKNPLVRSEILFNLGLTLVELCFGETLIHKRKPEDGNADDSTTRLNTAIRLHTQVDEEMGKSYGDVVRTCIFGLFKIQNIDLGDEEVQQKVLDDVIIPLVEDLNNFNGYFKIK